MQMFQISQKQCKTLIKTLKLTLRQDYFSLIFENYKQLSSSFVLKATKNRVYHVTDLWKAISISKTTQKNGTVVIKF